MIFNNLVPCVCCNEVRFTRKELLSGIDTKIRNVIFDDDTGKKWVIGCCRDCVNKDTMDYNLVSNNFYNQQKAYLEFHNLPLNNLNQIQDIKFKSHRKACA